MNLDLKTKIKNFILGNSLLRKIRITYVNSIKPAFIKIFLISVIFFLLTIFLLQIFSPNLLLLISQKFSHKLSQFLDHPKSNFYIINISGNQKIEKIEIEKVVNDFYAKTKEKNQENQRFIQNLIDEIKSQLPLARKITVSRTIPNLLNIAIVEFEPFAIWYENEQKFIIDREGINIRYKQEYEDLFDFSGMIILSGENANLYAKSLFNLISADPEIGSEIYSANWVGGRRWDLRFNNGVIVKMPEFEISSAWQEIKKILAMPSSSSLKIIDLRVKNKIYLESIDPKISKKESI